MQAEEGDDDAHGGWQQDADAFRRLGHSRDLAAQHKGGADQTGVGQGLPVLILDNLLVAKPGARCDQGVEKGFLACGWIKTLPKHAYPPEGLLPPSR